MTATTPRTRKAKGRVFQAALAEHIREAYQCHVDDVKPVLMSGSGMDLQLSPAFRERFPYAVECKNQESLSIWQALKQAEANAGGLIPVLAFKRARSPTYAVIPWDEFIALTKCREWCRE